MDKIYDLKNKTIINILTLFAFLSAILVIFFKLIVFESINPDLCANYILAFFYIQFITPIILLGENYRSTKENIKLRLRKLSINPFLLILIILPFFMLPENIGTVGVLAFSTAIYNQNLELLKIDGYFGKVVSCRFLKPVFEIILIFVFVKYFNVDLEHYLIAEALLLLFLTIAYRHIKYFIVKVNDLNYIDLIKVSILTYRSGALRLFVPALSIPNAEKVFIGFFLYELYLQFSSYLTTKKSLQNNFKLIFIMYSLLLVSTPLQIFFIDFFLNSYYPELYFSAFYFPLYGMIIFPQMLFPLILRDEEETKFFFGTSLLSAFITIFILLIHYQLIDVALVEYVAFALSILAIESLLILYLLLRNKNSRKRNSLPHNK